MFSSSFCFSWLVQCSLPWSLFTYRDLKKAFAMIWSLLDNFDNLFWIVTCFIWWKLNNQGRTLDYKQFFVYHQAYRMQRYKHFILNFTELTFPLCWAEGCPAPLSWHRWKGVLLSQLKQRATCYICITVCSMVSLLRYTHNQKIYKERNAVFLFHSSEKTETFSIKFSYTLHR